MGLPDLVVRLLLSRWYSSQQLNVRLGKAYSNRFGVSNGVRQGGVLSFFHLSGHINDLI